MAVLLLVLPGLALIFIAAYAHHKKSASTALSIIGAEAYVEAALAPEGAVMINGEVWRARAEDNSHIEPGRQVRVRAAQGVLLIVEPV